MAANKRKKLIPEERKQIYDMFEGHCAYCGCMLKFEELTVDHVKPLDRKGGTDTIDNMFPACFSCNHEKGNLTMEKYRVKKGENTTFFFERYKGEGKAMEIKIKYFVEQPPLENIEGKSDWIDLRSAEDVEMKKGEFKLIPLGIGMILPDGYEAHIVPRSSTFKNFKILQTNSMGVIDNSYSGDNDEWKFPAYAVEDTVIHKGDRICQFRIMEKQPIIMFKPVEKLNDKDRGGFGSTGKK